MIYTIKCRRGHCGSQFAYESVARQRPEEAAKEGQDQARQRGWVNEYGSSISWLCPFDAPKEAAKAIHPDKEMLTHCGFPGCMTGHLTDNPAFLAKDGWRRVSTEMGKPAQWFCAACWKAGLPEPTAKPAETECNYSGCLNKCQAVSPECLKVNGWHPDASAAHKWYCQACWKSCQPEPQSPDRPHYCLTCQAVDGSPHKAWCPQTEPAPQPEVLVCEMSIDEVKEIAAEVFYRSMDRVLRSARNHSDDKKGVLELLRIGLSYLWASHVQPSNTVVLPFVCRTVTL